MPDLTNVFAERGDLAHLALFLWAACVSALLIFALRELAKLDLPENTFPDPNDAVAVND